MNKLMKPALNDYIRNALPKMLEYETKRNLKVTWEISTPDGNKKTGECKSLLKNFGLICETIFIASNNPSLKDITNTSRTVEWSTGTGASYAGSSYGTALIKSGTQVTPTAVTSTDSELQAVYQTLGTISVVDLVDTSSEYKYSVVATVAAISNTTVTEIGLYARFGVAGASTTFMIARDIVAGGFGVTNGVSYTIKFNFDWVLANGSYQKNFGKLWRGLLANTNETLTDVTNASFAARINTGAGGALSTTRTGNNLAGIITFGTGNTAAVMADYKLAIQSDSGGAVTDTIITADSTRYKFMDTVSFVFTAGKTITEIALFGYISDNTATGHQILMSRYVLGSPISVATSDAILARFIHDVAV